MSSELPDQIEFIVEKDSTTTISFHLPGSILRISEMNDGVDGLSAFRTIEHDQKTPISMLGNVYALWIFWFDCGLIRSFVF